MSDERARGNGDEALSALVDGELDAGERRRLVDHLLDEPELRARWGRYHAARASLEGNDPSVLDPGFSERVLAAVGSEPAVPAPGRARAGARRGRPAMAAALAAGVAGVALAAVLLLRDTSGEGAGPAVAGSGETEPAATVAAGGSAGAGLDAVDRARVRERLAVYLNSHSEFAAVGEMPGVMPYSRMVGFNAGQ